MFCTACGVKNVADSNFCRQCGKPLEKTTAPKISEAEYARALPENEQVIALLENAYQHRAKGDLLGAMSLCEEAVRLHPESVSAHSTLAQFCTLMGDRDRAIKEYERVLQLNPASVADRIKLEEVRSGKMTSGAARAAANTDNGSAFHPLALIAAAAALLAVGAVMGDQWKRSRGFSDKTPLASGVGLLNNDPTRANPSGTPQQIAQNPNSPYGVPQTNGANNPNFTPNGANPATQSAPQNQLPNMGAGPSGAGQQQYIAAPPFYPSIQVNPNAPAPTPAGQRAPRNNGVGTLPAYPVAGGTLQNASAPAPGSRVRLSDPEERYNIRIDVGSNKAETPGANSGAQPNLVSNNANPASSDSRASLEAANQHMIRSDFSNSLKFFRKALDGAGHQKGQIYQNIAYCYQQKGDKASARVNYEQAIAEYQSMINQGVQKEVAEDGLRACKRGLKLCD